MVSHLVMLRSLINELEAVECRLMTLNASVIGICKTASDQAVASDTVPRGPVMKFDRTKYKQAAGVLISARKLVIEAHELLIEELYLPGVKTEVKTG